MNLSNELIAKIKLLIAQYTGIKVRDKEQKKLISSILLRIDELQITNPAFYYQNLMLESKESQEEITKLVCSFANKESYFFRDKGHFTTLKNQIFPNLIKEKSTQKTLKIWSAGCSTGEEPYSIAMLLFSLLPDWMNWKLTILGTDLCYDTIEKARQGLFDEISLRAMGHKERLIFFSKQSDGQWLIAPFLREGVTFEQNNLVVDPFPSDMDLIICRNVFIYFQQDAITKVINKFHQALNPGGYLLIGHGELQDTLVQPFKKHLLQGALVYQK